ncbi:MAG: carboxypeptidase-like regulatory domain-containing protein [Ignavibacteriaceae bacterium]|nr:carboxypeptidase-like regulatory domain-containing protein [Ignavibacteriaceae bacterium]
MKKLLLFFLLTTLFISIPVFSQVGKINGVIRDAQTGEALIGANIIVEGTTIGAAANIDGFYVITNVPPGTFNLRASMVGYTQQVIQNVRVNIDLTTEINVNLTSQTIGIEEVVVIAQIPVVRQDVSSSVVNLNIKEIENLPVVSVSSVIGLQAGVQGLTVRGGASDQTAFVVNGITLRDERDNTPYTGISFTSIEELQIQTGGFNAEYGNIRSGLINVVTKEGKKDKYNFSFLGRYGPQSRKHFGDAANSPNSYWIRPYIDDDVAWTGTDNGNWDIYTQRQYQPFSGGWNNVSETLLADDDPNNDLTPEAAQRLFLWQHRKQVDINDYDYDLDMSFSGPVPYGQELGNLRFATSYRQSRSMYLIPLSDDAYRDFNGTLRITSDVGQGMKLSVEGLIGKQTGTNFSRSGGPGLFTSTSGIASNIDWRSGASYLDARLYSTDYWNPATIYTNMQSFKFTHAISSKTFYEVIGSRVAFEYDTYAGDPRYYYKYDENGVITGFSDVTDTSKGIYVGGIFYDMAPFGYYSGSSSQAVGSKMNMGLGYSNSRDSSKLNTYTLRFDYASQVDKYNYLKTGFEFIYTENLVNYALIEPSLPSNNAVSSWSKYPKKVGLYAQDKLEFEGMIANLGLRLDILDPGGEWYVFDEYNKALSGAQSANIDVLLEKEPVKTQFNLSPRLGIAFPISVNSKLYFNYGHFRSMPAPENLFLLRISQAFQNVTRIADPSVDLPKTIAYELGFEQNLFDQFLLGIKGYYKDVTNQPRLVRYTSRDNTVNYQINEPNNYADIRGFEIDLRKNRGEWVTGFVNYTYMVTTSGFFGLGSYPENPAQLREVESNTRALYQSKPVPQPYARASVDVFTPVGWGPELGGIKVLDQIRLNILASWSSGTYFSYTGRGGTMRGYENNIQWSDFLNVNLRLSKTLNFGPVGFELFMDVINVFNIKYMSYQAGFVDQNDWDDYITSLHLPEYFTDEFNYGNIPGDDVPGMYRDFDTPYQPLEYVRDISLVTSPNQIAYYYDALSGQYFQWSGEEWSQVSDSRIEEVLDNKAYVDMPNLHYTTFLNPRNFYFGIKFNIDL